MKTMKIATILALVFTTTAVFAEEGKNPQVQQDNQVVKQASENVNKDKAQLQQDRKALRDAKKKRHEDREHSRKERREHKKAKHKEKAEQVQPVQK